MTDWNPDKVRFTTEQIHDCYRLALSYLRALTSDDDTLAEEIMRQFKSPEEAWAGFMALSAGMAGALDRMIHVDKLLDKMIEEAAIRNGPDV